MSTLTRFLFPVPAPRSTRAIVAWWEARRLAFNVIVGAAGLVTLAAVWMLAALPPYGAILPLAGPLGIGVILYGVMANVCYTLGWVTEAGMHALWGESVEPAGAVLFRHGLVFSVGLTLLPILLSVLFWCARIAGWLLGVGGLGAA